MKNGNLTRAEHLNRTGASLSPELTAELLESTSATEPTADGDAQAIAQVRIMYAQAGEPVGSVPPPASMKATIKTVAKAITGKKMLVFVDKLGERLAFERSGTRLYDGLLSKFDAYGTWDGGPSRSDLQEIRDEEFEHFLMLRTCIEELGGDPTAVTPSADLHAVASKGLCAVISDPRTGLRESLEAILLAELVDNDCWENLSDLAASLGQSELSSRFDAALEQEREHLRRVRLWLGNALSLEATGAVAEPFSARTAERDRRLAAGEGIATTAQRTGKPSTARPRRPSQAGAKSQGKRKSAKANPATRKPSRGRQARR